MWNNYFICTVLKNWNIHYCKYNNVWHTLHWLCKQGYSVVYHQCYQLIWVTTLNSYNSWLLQKWQENVLMYIFLPIPYSLYPNLPRFQNESWWTTFHCLLLARSCPISIRTVVHQDSFWNRCKTELGNGL